MTPTAEIPLKPISARQRSTIMEAISDHPLLFTAALLTGALVVVGALMVIDWFADSEEAPIRVKNGSIDLYILSASQKWEQVGTSGNWRIKDADRYRTEFEVTVAVRTGATCGGSLTATGSDVVFTYSNDKVVRLDSAGQHTLVKPENGASMTWDQATPQKLAYVVSGGHIRSIAVGNGANPATICSFSAPGQLDHVIVLNVP